MKTVSGTVKLVIVAAIGVTGLFIFRAFAEPDDDQPPCPVEPDAKFVLKIHNRHPLATDGDAAEKAFGDLLAKYDNKLTRIHFRHAKVDPVTGKPKEEFMPPRGPHVTSTMDIKTDKVTASELAKKTTNDDLTLIAPHVTQQVSSNKITDITKVLNLLATP